MNDESHNGASPYLRTEDINRLKSYRFAPAAVVEGYYAGRHCSHRRGSSTEFQEYRQYAPGDDPALLDWRVFARTDRHVIRTFEQETDLNCTILLDASGSMGFGSNPSKLEYASFFVAALAYLVIRTGDRVALQIFDDDIRESLPHGGTRRHLYQVLNILERTESGNRTSLSTALRRSFPTLRQRGPLVIVSDFLDEPGPLFEALGQYLHAGFSLYLFQVLDPGELALQSRGLVTYRDLEDGRRVIADAQSIRDRYSQLLRDHLRTLRAMSVRRRIVFDTARTDNMFYHFFDRL